MTLQKYLKPDIGSAYVKIGISLILPIFLTYLLVFKKDSFTNLPLLIIIDIVLWIIVVYKYYFSYSYPLKEYRRNMKLLKERGILKLAEDDFTHAETYFKNGVLIGDKYIFGLNRVGVIPISSIDGMKIVKILYTGAITDIEWNYYLIENGMDILFYHSDYYYQPEWENLAKKLKSVNPDIKVKRNIETKTVFVEESYE